MLERNSVDNHHSQNTLIKVLLVFASIVLGLLLLAPMDSAGQLIASFTLIAIINICSRIVTAHNKYRDFFRVLAMILGVAITLRYLLWRSFYTLETSDWVSLLPIYILFIAEVYTSITYIIGCFVNVLPMTRPDLTIEGLDEADLPTVDVMIPSYNEDADMLENTLRAALMLDYPKDKFYVRLLDDGGTDEKINQQDIEKANTAKLRRENLQALCSRLGVFYHTRAKNLHAKAGNVNSAIEDTDADLIVILDADHVPTVDFLSRTVPWMMRDDKVFLVQTPHFMANPDVVERNYFRAFERMPQETDMFYGTIQKGLDFWSATFFCGSAAVLRRKHLALVGGISMDTITEDAETALSLHALGYKSVYVSRTMVSGLAPETSNAFLTQRTRWAQGMVQIMLLKRKQLFGEIPWYQTLGYLSSMLFWLFPFARMTFLVMPLAYLVLGLQIYHASALDVFAYTIPHVIGTYMISNMLFGKTRWPFVSEIYEMLQSAFTFKALIQVFRNPRAPSFSVTPKGEELDKDYVSSVSDVFYWMLLISMTATGLGLYKLLSDPLTWSLTLIVLTWNTFNVILLLGILNVLIEKRQIRGQPRIPAYDDVSLLDESGQCWKGNLVDVSIDGVKVRLNEKCGDMPSEMRLAAWSDAEQCLIELLVKLRHYDPKKGLVRLQFEKSNETEKQQIIGFTMGSSARWQAFQRRRTRPINYLHGVKHVLQISLKPIFRHVWLQVKVIRQKYLLGKTP